MNASQQQICQDTFSLACRLQATFTTANTLVLNNASSTAQFYGKGELLMSAALCMTFTWHHPHPLGPQFGILVKPSRSTCHNDFKCCNSKLVSCKRCSPAIQQLHCTDCCPHVVYDTGEFVMNTRWWSVEHDTQELTRHPVATGARAGVIPTNTFANDTAGAKYVSSNGQW